MVCASTSSQGLLCLDSSGFRQFTRRNSQLADDRIVDLVVCGDTMYMAAGEEVIEFDGTSFGRPSRVGRGLVERISCFGKDDLWAASQTALSHRDRNGWRHYELGAVAGSAGRNARVRGLAAGPNGAVWATIGEGTVLTFNGEEWRLFRQGQGFRARHTLGSLAVDLKGQVWLPYAKGLYTWKQERWDTVRGLPGANFITVDDKNRLWLTSGARVASFENGRKREIPTEQNTRAVAVDGAGVVWAATEFGLARFGGVAWDSRQMHNSELADNDLMLVATLGKGVALPPVIAQAKGSLYGKAQWSDDKPIAGADVQICGVRAFDFGINKGPCDDKPLSAQAKTTADGSFRFAGLAPGNYYFVVRAPGGKRWVRFATDPDRLKVRPGENKSVGIIVIDARRRNDR
ncbi:MAG: carboxypeptidase regulatory-like domain-containing protein [Rhodospirillaceae bacterium]|nr:carboxypeptidase regulatory-like domain-containing protein [Rhodospirillaceae bacterium]